MLTRSGFTWARTISAPGHCNCSIRTPAISMISKTRVAPKTSQTDATAWWLASNSKNMPRGIKCHINKSLPRTDTNPVLLGQKTSAWDYFTPTMTNAKSSPTQNWIALGKLVDTYIFPASWSFTAQSSCNLLLQLQQRHPCEWQD